MEKKNKKGARNPTHLSNCCSLGECFLPKVDSNHFWEKIM